MSSLYVVVKTKGIKGKNINKKNKELRNFPGYVIEDGWKLGWLRCISRKLHVNSRCGDPLKYLHLLYIFGFFFDFLIFLYFSGFLIFLDFWGFSIFLVFWWFGCAVQRWWAALQLKRAALLLKLLYERRCPVQERRFCSCRLSSSLDSPHDRCRLLPHT